MRRRRFGPNPLWRKAPLVYFRFPLLLASIFVGSSLLAGVVVGYPLFATAAGGDLVREGIADGTVSRYGAGVRYERVGIDVMRLDAQGSPLIDRIERGFRARASEIPYLGTPVATLLGPVVSVEVRGDSVTPGRLLARTEILEHVDLLSGSRAASGVWIADSTAEALDAGRGDRIDLIVSDRKVSVPVAGVYRGLFNYFDQFDPKRRLSGYWRSLTGEIYPPDPQSETIPPPFVIAGRGEVIRLSERLGDRRSTFIVEAPIAESRSLTLDQARSVEHAIERFRRSIAVGGLAISVAPNRTKPLYCCDRYADLASSMPVVVKVADERLTSLKDPLMLVVAVGICVALVVVAAAGAFSMATREVEATLLHVRGFNPATIFLRSCLESVVPCVGAALVGGLLSFLGVRELGPPGPIDARTALWAVALGAVAAAGSMIVVGLTAVAYSIRQSHATRGVASRVVALPWEIGLLAVAGLAFLRIASIEGATDEPSGTPSTILLIVFSVSLIVGLAVPAARLFRRGLTVLKGRRKASIVVYLSSRQLLNTPVLSLLLLSLAAVSFAIALETGSISSSLQATVDSKAKLFVGSDVQAWVPPDTRVPDRLELPATKVTRILHAGSVAGQPFDLLMIDPNTFVRAAFWNEAFGGDLNALVEPLSRAPAGDPVPAIVAGGMLPRSVSLDFEGNVAPDANDVPIEIVSSTSTFPGSSSRSRPLLITARDGLAPWGVGSYETFAATTEIWVRGRPENAVEELSRFDLRPYGVLTAEEVKEIPYIRAVVGSFVALNLLAASATVLVLAVILMYVRSRQRKRLLADSLSLRMGMTRTNFRIGTVLQLGGTLAAAFAIAIVLSTFAARTVVTVVDPLPAIPPGPLFVVSVGAVWATLAVLVATVAGAAALIERQTRRADIGRLLRAAE